MQDPLTLKKRARAGRETAEISAAHELGSWWKAEKAKIDEDPELGDIARKVATRELMMEFGKRSNRALAKAKRDNSLPKTLEREMRAEIEAERANKQR
jgi:hypothetical protein